MQKKAMPVKKLVYLYSLNLMKFISKIKEKKYGEIADEKKMSKAIEENK